jgi:hypothetical protein
VRSGSRMMPASDGAAVHCAHHWLLHEGECIAGIRRSTDAVCYEESLEEFLAELKSLPLGEPDVQTKRRRQSGIWRGSTSNGERPAAPSMT